MEEGEKCERGVGDGVSGGDIEDVGGIKKSRVREVERENEGGEEGA